MTGVEILTSSEVVVEHVFNWKAFWITFIVSWIAMFVISVIIYIADGGLNAAFIPYVTITCGIIAGLGFGVVFGAVVCSTPSKYATEYKVTISDEVSMNEFYERYEVIEQDGKIYTVRERF